MTAATPMPGAGDCVLRELLRRRAAETPDKTFIRFADGGEWSYAETLAQTLRTAAGLQALGLEQDQRVLSWLANGRDAIRVWFGANELGAAYVPINTAYRGNLLAHVIENSEASLIVAHADLAPRLNEIEHAGLGRAVIVGGPPPPLDGLEVLDQSALAPNAAEPAPPPRPVQPWDLQSIVYTSGTTGPSKGVLSSYGHLYAMAVESWDLLGPDDRYLVNLPLFHVGGTAAVYAMLGHGGSLAIVDSFDTAGFWPTVRETGSTVVVLLGVMTPFLLKQPARADDKDHPLRLGIMVPLVEEAPAFAKRFGIDIVTCFNMTEVSCPIRSARNPGALGAAGRPRPGVELRIVDEHDIAVPDGEVGELIVRTDRPWAMNHGYNRNPEATAAAWRNGWFHTGDAFRRDAGGDYYFVDRMKDAIRRRGENISSFEVEAEVQAHPAVNEAAAIPVPSDDGEDEVMVVLAPAPGQTIDPAELIAFLVPRMAHFMIPRYLRVLAALPKTPTQKVRKHQLRAQGITADTWDREAAGIRIRRQRIGADD